MENLAEKFKRENNIIDVISKTVKLKKVGKEYFGLCPFHSEKTPSFSVSIEKQIYNCFGCDESGDVIDFIMKIENKTFEEVVGVHSKTKEFILNYLMNKEKYTTKNDKRYEYNAHYIYTTSINNVMSLKIKYKNSESGDKTFKQLIFDFRCSKPVVTFESKFNEEIFISIYADIKVKRSIENNRYIFIVEGEKDADTLNSMGYTATTFPKANNVNKINLNQLENANIILLGDTGKVGEKKKLYSKNILLKANIKSLRVPVLKGLNQLGDNKDISDWIKGGKIKKDIENCINDSWDIKKNPKFKILGIAHKGTDKEKEYPLKVWENLYSLLVSQSITVRYNELSREIEIQGAELDKDDIDSVITKVRTLCCINNFTLFKNDVWDFIKTMSRQNKFNPVLEYLKVSANVWDGRSRIQELCDTIQGAGNKKNNDSLITKWLLNAIHTISNYGLNNQEGILVLQGEQGIGKTRWIRSIVPNADWVKTGSKVDPSDKDSVAKVTKYWITELGEMDATLKKDQAELKQFFTEPVDEYREPYSITSKKFPRLTCFFATVNDEEFLRDTTGNRRYWVISANKINVDHNINLTQLWGEIYLLYKSNTINYYLDETELNVVNSNNELFEVKTAIEIKLQDLFKWDINDPYYWEKISCTEIGNILNGNESVVIIGKAIKKMMKTNSNIKFDSNGRKYLLPPSIYNTAKIRAYLQSERNNRIRSVK
ncbi:VapE domain-containing protein [Clostridium sp.]|uniref:VapE domain-containing protein n=1 Tax=Clostridium sp. TaxID=1506 RepID=UPI003D6D71DD